MFLKYQLSVFVMMVLIRIILTYIITLLKTNKFHVKFSLKLQIIEINYDMWCTI